MSVVSNENKEMLWDLIIDICNDNSFQVNGEELKNFLDGRCGYYHGQRFEFQNFNLGFSQVCVCAYHTLPYDWLVLHRASRQVQKVLRADTAAFAQSDT